MKRGMNSGGKAKPKTKSTTYKRVGKRQAEPAFALIKEVDSTKIAQDKPLVYQFAIVNGKQFNKCTKPIYNRDYFEIVATAPTAFRFAEKWATKNKVTPLYLIQVTEEQE